MRLGLFLVVVGMMMALPGWAGDGAVALQTGDPSCRTTTTPPPRYVDCGNGTVTDNLTGLVWLKNASCFQDLDPANGKAVPVFDWHSAMDIVAGLSDLLDSRVCIGLTPDECDCGLDDGSSPGEWRLPSVDEWYTMTASAVLLGCTDPILTNDAGNDCWDPNCVTVENCSFQGVQSSWYWSSSSEVAQPLLAWGVDLHSPPPITDFQKTLQILFVWPVRDGQ